MFVKFFHSLMQLPLVQGGFDCSELKIIKSMLAGEEGGRGNCRSLTNVNTQR